MVKFDELKKNRGNRSKRPPNASSVIAEVVSVDADNDRVEVKLTEMASASLQIDEPAESYPISIRKAVSDRQPNLNDLLGKEGGKSSAPMTVEPGSFIRMENVVLEGNGSLSTGWLTLAAGPNALAGDAREARLLTGMVKTSYRNVKDQDGNLVRKWDTDIMFPEKAVGVETVASLSDAVGKVLDDPDLAGMDRKTAIVRFTNKETGEPVHDFVNRRMDRESQELESSDSAVARFVEKNKLDDQSLAAISVEVIPSVRVSPGTEARKLMNCEMQKALKDNWFNPNRRYSMTEIHPDQRLRPSGGVNSRNPASERSLEAARRLAEQRDRKVEFGENPTQGQISAFIEDNNVRMGWARGDVLVRFKNHKETGEPYCFAGSCATMTRTGIQLDAVQTPHSTVHADWLKREQQESRDIRKAAYEETVIIDGDPTNDTPEDEMHDEINQAYEQDPVDAVPSM